MIITIRAVTEAPWFTMRDDELRIEAGAGEMHEEGWVREFSPVQTEDDQAIVLEVGRDEPGRFIQAPRIELGPG